MVGALSGLQRHRVALGLPKFELEREYKDDLKAALMAFGISQVFQGGLCVYENDCNAFLDYVIQKTFISVDENGVEAAAVTAGARPT